ncbi:Protein T26C12.3, partial [Aphelenchoides avenae]
SSSGFEETEESHDPPPSQCLLQSEPEEEACIRRCSVALFGGPKVGKSQLMRTQFLNSMFFGHIDESPKSANAKPTSRRGSSEVHAKFMLSIIDNNNVKDDLKEAHGVILVYAVDDRQSVETVKSIFQEIRLRRRDNPPMILVANKADLPGTQRQFSTFEGEQLAMAFECPFLEVSSRRNEGVNEAFTQLVHMVDRQQTPALAATTTTHL